MADFGTETARRVSAPFRSAGQLNGGSAKAHNELEIMGKLRQFGRSDRACA
jgi:hypothetical protein